jgi:hypothetical protein
MAQNKPKPVSTPLDIVDHQYDKIFKTLSKLEKGDIITRPNCKFCNHPIRHEAEEKWERSTNYAAVLRFFDEYRDKHPEAPKMKFVNVRGHILNHYNNQLKKIRMREYSDSLLDLMNERIQKDHMLETMSVALYEKFFDIASDNSLDPLRRADTLTKLHKSVGETAKLQAELRGDTKPINLFAEKMMNVWINAINSETDDTMKRKFIDVLETMQVEVQTLPFEE